MEDRKCDSCFYYDVCDGDEECEYYDSLLGDDISDDELRAEFYKSWFEYIDNIRVPDNFEDYRGCLDMFVTED